MILIKDVGNFLTYSFSPRNSNVDAFHREEKQKLLQRRKEIPPSAENR
jgi:hypothetical protein